MTSETRCDAIQGQGWRCTRDAKWLYNGDNLCTQHMRSRDMKAHGAIKPVLLSAAGQASTDREGSR